jgi:hypothetical protein
MERRKHWWNGRWGQAARRDIRLCNDGDLWQVEDRRGAAAGASRWWQLSSEEAALDLVRDLMTGEEVWTETGNPLRR